MNRKQQIRRFFSDDADVTPESEEEGMFPEETPEERRNWKDYQDSQRAQRLGEMAERAYDAHVYGEEIQSAEDYRRWLNEPV